MPSEQVQAALNLQITREIHSGYLYLSMAAYFEDLGLKGFAHWMRVQHREEENHGLMMYGYLNAAGGRVRLQEIEAPATEWPTPLAAFEEVLAHEQQVTAWIHEIVDLALAEKDHATANFLQWFVSEQVEEVATAKELHDTLKLLGNSGPSLLLLDRELAGRTFTVPAEATKWGVL
ncbi:MAG: ferritin [Fimbriimonadaceae bacterium]|nr:ferritin [Fimbriimonadaceae bacterium]